MPKIDFTKAVNQGISFPEMRVSGNEVVMPSKENMIKNGFTPEYVNQNYDKLQSEYELFSVGKFTGNYIQNTNKKNLLPDYDMIDIWRGPGYSQPVQYTGTPYKYGWSESGEMTATPTQVAYNRGYYYDKNGEKQEIGSWLQRTWDTFTDVANVKTAVLDDTGNYVFKEVDTWKSGAEQLEESRIAQKHAGGVNKTISRPGDLFIMESIWNDIDAINAMNNELLKVDNMELMGFRPQKLSRTWMGEGLNALNKTIATAIPKIANMAVEQIVETQFAFALETGDKEKIASAMYDLVHVEQATSIYHDAIDGRRSYAARMQSAWSGRNMSASIGEAIGQVALMYGGGAAFGPAAASVMGPGLMMADSQRELIRLGIDPQDRAWLTPVIGAISWGVEMLGPNVIINTFSKNAAVKNAAIQTKNAFISEGSKKALTEAGIKSWSTATGSQKLAFAKSFGKNIAGMYNNTIIKAALGEGTEEVIEQFADDILYNTYDFANRNTENKPLFNDWDNQRNYLGNLFKDMNFLDDYVQSFLIGGIGGGFGGIITSALNNFKRETGLDKFASMVAQGKGQQIIDFLNSDKGKTVMGGWYTDGTKVLNEDEKKSGILSVGDQLRNTMIAEIQNMMNVYETYGIKNAKMLKAFGDDMSLAGSAIAAASSIEKLKNQKSVMETSLSEITDEKQKKDIQAKIVKIDSMIEERTKLLDYFTKPENNTFSKAYNDRQKEFASVMEISKSLANKEIQKKEQEENRVMTDKEKNGIIASYAYSVFNDIAKKISKNPYSVYRNFFTKVQKAVQGSNEFNIKENERRNNLQVDISNQIANLTNSLNNLSASKPVLDEINKILNDVFQSDPNATDDENSKNYAKHIEKQSKEINNRGAEINKYSQELTNLIENVQTLISQSNDIGVSDDNDIAIKQLQQGVKDAIDNVEYLVDFKTINNIPAPIVENLSNRLETYEKDLPTKKLHETTNPVYEGENAIEDFINDYILNNITSIEEGIRSKNEPMGLKSALNKLDAFVSNTEQSYLTSKAVSDMDEEHHSKDDVIKSENQISNIQKIVNDAKEKIEGLKTKVNELSSDKDVYAKYYRKNIVKSHFLLWKNMLLQKAGVFFGPKSDQVVKLIDQAEQLIIDKENGNVMLDDDRINDDKLIELDRIIGDLWQIYYENKDVIYKSQFEENGEKINGIQWIMSQFDFGLNGLKSMTGQNAIIKNDIDGVMEPIMYFSVPNGKDNHIDYQAEPWRVRIDMSEARIGLYDKNVDYYSLFIAQNLFASVLANLGESTNNMTRLYNDMEAAQDYNKTEKNVSSLEQSSYEILCAQLMCLAASKNNYMKEALQYYVDLSIKRWSDKNPVTNQRINNKGIKEEDILGRLINFPGFGGSGKTNNSLLKAVELFRLATGRSNLNVSVSAFNEKTTLQLEEVFNGSKINVKSKRTFSKNKGIDNLDYNVDVVIFDEASFLSIEKLNSIVTNARKTNAIVLNLSDNTQMGESIIDRPLTHDYGITINPLMLVFRTNIPQIIQLSDYFRNKVVFGTSTKDLPKVYAQIENNKLYGAKYFRTRNDIFATFNSRIQAGANAILIVKDVDEYNTVIAQNPNLNGKVFIVTKDEGTADLSIQGRQGEEVFITFDIDANIPGNVGYTSVTRARNFVGFVNSSGKNANDISEVYWNTTPYELTKEQKVAKSKELMEYNRRTRNFKIGNSQQYASNEKKKTTQQTPGSQQPPVNKGTQGGKNKEEYDSLIEIPGENVVIGDLVNFKGTQRKIATILQGKTSKMYFVIFEGDKGMRSFNQEIKDGLIEDNTGIENPIDDSPEIINEKEIELHKIDRVKHAYATHYNINFTTDVQSISPEFASFMRALKNSLIGKNIFNTTPVKVMTRHLADDGTIAVESEKIFMTLDSLTLNSVIKILRSGRYRLPNGNVYNMNEIADFDIEVAKDILYHFAVLGTTTEVNSMYNAINSNPSAFTQNTAQTKIINGKIHGTLLNSYSNVKTLDQVIPELKAKGLNVKILFSKVTGGIPTLVVSAHDGSESRIPLTAFTLAEFNERGRNEEATDKNGNPDIISRMIDDAIDAVESGINSGNTNSEKLQNAVKNLCTTRWYQFVKKNRKSFNNELISEKGFDRLRTGTFEDVLRKLQETKAIYSNDPDGFQTKLSEAFMPITTSLSVNSLETLSDVRNNGKFDVDVFAPRIFFSFTADDSKIDNSNQIIDDEWDSVFASQNPNFLPEKESVASSQTTSTEQAISLMNTLWGESMVQNGFKIFEGPRTVEYYEDGIKVITSITGLTNQTGIYVSSINGQVKVTTPKHEFAHWVMRYNISPDMYSKLLAEAKQMIYEETGLPLDAISERMANEHIAEMYGNTGMTLSRRDTWYSKFPAIAKFIEMLRQAFSRLGLYKYKIADLMYAMDMGYFANAKVGLDNFYDDLYQESEVGTDKKSLRKKDPELISKLGNNKTALDWAVKTYAIVISNRSRYNPYTDSTQSVKDSIKEVFARIEKHEPTEVLTSVGKSLQDVYADSELYMSEILKNQKDFKTYLDFVLYKSFHKKQLNGLIFRGTVDTRQAESQISDKARTIDQKDKINALVKWQMTQIPLKKTIKNEDGSTTEKIEGFVSIGIIDNILASLTKTNNISGPVDFITKLKDRADIMSKDGVAKDHVTSFIDHIQAIINKSIRLEDTNSKVSNDIMNFINGYFSNRGNLVRSDVESAELVYDQDQKIVKLSIQSKNPNTTSQMKTHVKNRISNTLSNGGEGVKRKVQDFMRDNFIFTSDGITIRSSKEPLVSFQTNNKGEKVLNLNIKAAPSAFSRMKSILGLNTISDSMFFDVISAKTVSNIPGYDYMQELNSNINIFSGTSVQEYMGAQLGMFLALVNQQSLIGKVEAAINNLKGTYAIELDENSSSIMAVKLVTGEELPGFKDIAIKNPDKDLQGFAAKVLSEKNIVTGNLLMDDIGNIRIITDWHNKKYGYIPENVNYLVPEELALFTDIFAGIKALNNETNTTTTYTDPEGARRTINNPRAPINKITSEKVKEFSSGISEDSYLNDGNNGAISMFIGTDNWKVLEFEGARVGSFGKTELDPNDRMLIDLTNFRRQSKKGKFRIPLIPFGASMRSHYLEIKFNAEDNMNKYYTKALKNGLNRSKRAYDLSRKHVANSLDSFMNKVNLAELSSDVELNALVAKIEELRGLTSNDVAPDKFCKSFMEVQITFESLASTGNKNYLDLYSKYYSSILGSGMYQTRDYVESGTMYYTKGGEYFKANELNDIVDYAALKRIRPGNAMKFGLQLNEQGERQSLKARDDNGIFREFAHTSNIWNYDFYNNPTIQKLLNTPENIIETSSSFMEEVMDEVNIVLSDDMRYFASIASQVFFEMDETKDKKLMTSKTIKNNEVYYLDNSEKLYDYYISTLLFGEDFNASFTGAHFDFKDSEDNRKRLKQYLTGCTYGNSIVLNNGMNGNFITICTSTQFGLADFGNGVSDIVKSTDGGAVLSSLGNRVHQTNLGSNYSVFEGKMKKPLATTFDPVSGENISMKEAAFEPTDVMIENNRDLMKMQVIMLNATQIQETKNGEFVRLGDLYYEMFNDGMKHSAIIDVLYDKYINAFFRGDLALQFSDQETSKITPKNINFGTIDDLFQKSINGEEIVSRTHKVSDLGFIYNPEINVDEDSQAMKVIQQESILPIANERYSRDINKILWNMNEFAHDEFVAENGFDLRDLTYGPPSVEMEEKIKKVVRDYAVRGLENRNSFGTLVDIMKYLSFDIPPVLETAYQSWVNIHAGDFGHRKKIAGDRNMKMFGQGFKMIEKDGIRYNLQEYADFFNNGVRLTDEQVETLNAQPIRYMKLDENNLIQREEAVGSFKYFDFFSLRDGEQPTHLMSIWKKDEVGNEVRLDLRNGFEDFILKRGDVETKFHTSQDKDGITKLYEDNKEVNIERYASMYYTYMANNKDIYDFDKSPLLRNNEEFDAQFSDKIELLLVDGILNFQSSRIPFTSHSYFTLSNLVVFTNNKSENEDGSIRRDHSNLMFRNGRGNARDGADFDADASTDLWLSIVEYKDEYGFRRYHAKTSEEVANPNFKKGANPEYKTEANSLFWKHESIMNDPDSYEFSFRLTSTEGFKKVKAERYGKRVETIEGQEISPVQERTNPATYYVSERLNSSDKDLIGHQAQGLSVTAELIQLPEDAQRKILPGVNFAKTHKDKIRMMSIYDSQMQTILDGEKDNISGPFGLIKEFSGINQHFLDNNDSIPLFMLPGENYKMHDEDNAIFDEVAIYEFFNQPVMRRLRNRVMRGRRLMESSFSQSLTFAISEEIVRSIDRSNIRESDLELLDIKGTDMGVYDVNVIRKLNDIVGSEGINVAITDKRAAAEKILRHMHDIRILNELQNRLPAIDSKRHLGTLVGFRKSVWAKTTDTKNKVRQIELLTGMPIQELTTLFLNTDGTLKSRDEIDKNFTYDPAKAAEFYKNNSSEFYRTTNGGYILKVKSSRKYTEDYLAYIDNLFKNMNVVEYFKYYPHTLSYMRNMIIDNNIRMTMSNFLGQNLDAIHNEHFKNISVNDWQFDAQEVEVNDQYGKYVIESAIAGMYDGVKIGVSSWYENDETKTINDSYSSLNIAIATDRNLFSAQTPELIRCFIEIGDIARTDKEQAKTLIKRIIAINKWKLMDDTSLNALVENMPTCDFLKNIELFGRGVSRGVQYASQEFGEYDSQKLIKQRNDLSLYPKEFIEIIKIFNVLRFGYRTKKTFFDPIGSDIYVRIDNYIQENKNTIMSGNQYFLPAMYSLVKGLPYGTQLVSDGVIMNDYQKSTNIKPGKEGKGSGITNVHVHRYPQKEGDSITYKDVVRFNKYPEIGGNYRVATTKDVETYTENPVVKTLNSEEIGNFLKFGSVTVINVKGNYPEYMETEKGKAERVVYQLAGQFAYAKHVGDELTFTKIQNETAETLSRNLEQSKIIIDTDKTIGLLEKKRNEKLEESDTVYTNVGFYDTGVSEKFIRTNYGDDYFIVCEGIYKGDGKKQVSGKVIPVGTIRSLQFVKNTIKLNINSSYKMNAVWAPDIESITDPIEKKIAQENLDIVYKRVKQAVEDFKAELLQAMESGNIILFPNFGRRGLGFALAGNPAYRDIYEDLSKFLYDNFGYYNLASESIQDQEVLSLSENPSEAIIQKFNELKSDSIFVGNVKRFLKNKNQNAISGIRGNQFLDLFNKYVEQMKEFAAERIEQGKVTNQDIYYEAKKTILKRIEQNSKC